MMSCSYDETWKDKPTSYNGQAVSYDACGNPMSFPQAGVKSIITLINSSTAKSCFITTGKDITEELARLLKA